DLAVEGVLELAVGNLDVLDRAEDVGELQPEELHLFALGALEDLRFRFPLGGFGTVRGRAVRLRHGLDSSQLFAAPLRLMTVRSSRQSQSRKRSALGRTLRY